MISRSHFKETHFQIFILCYSIVLNLSIVSYGGLPVLKLKKKVVWLSSSLCECVRQWIQNGVNELVSMQIRCKDSTILRNTSERLQKG